MDYFRGTDVNALALIHRCRRKHESYCESYIIKKLLMPLEGAQYDDFGNVIVKINGIGDNIMWACHTDTVHRADGAQRVVLKVDGTLVLSGSSSNCLGADCGAGMWLMREMILAGKPGLYVFHRGEECGGLGSRWIAANTPELVKEIKACISLDRRGIDSVITKQSAARCSNEFADSLIAALDMGYEKDTGGTFTDSASYVSLIGECTNISVGYYNQHTSKEELDTKHLVALRHKLVSLDTTKLVFKLQPGEGENNLNSDFSWWKMYPYYRSMEEETEEKKSIDKEREIEEQHMVKLLEKFPEASAAALLELGVTYDELLDSIVVNI